MNYISICHEQFFKGQHYAWLESNLVFEVARDLAEIEVPALTVHDEFIVPKSMEGAVLECRYTLGLNQAIYDSAPLVFNLRKRP